MPLLTADLAAASPRLQTLKRMDTIMITQENIVISTRPVALPRFVRRDFLSAHIIEVGILLQNQFGVEHAAAFLKNNFIHLDVAMRVLLRPSERRRPQN